MEGRININVSTTDYDKASREIKSTLFSIEDMVHEEDSFSITDSEFAFGWHFFVVSVSYTLMQKLSDQMNEEFLRLKGKTLEKKFLSWLGKKFDKNELKVKFALKEEMESSKFGIF